MKRSLLCSMDSFYLKLFLVCAIFTLSLCGALRVSGQSFHRPVPTTDYTIRMDCRPNKGCMPKYNRWYVFKKNMKSSYKAYKLRKRYIRHDRLISRRV
jgi:hypothetical protein